MAKILTNETKEDEQLGIADPTDTNQDATLAQTEAPPGSFTELSSKEEIVQNGLIRSGNFVTGSAGWRIRANGSAEFNDGTFRGALSAATIDIGGADATSFHVDIDGNLWSGAATFNIATNPFAVSNAGVLRAVSGTIGGWTLAATTLVGGNITLDQANNRVTVGATNPVIINGADGTISSNGLEWSLKGDGTITGIVVRNIIASIIPANDTNENSVFSYTVPANTMSTNRMLFVRIPVRVSGTTAVTITLRLKFGGATIATATVQMANVGGGTALDATGYIEAHILENGATNAQVVYLGGTLGLGGSVNNLGGNFMLPWMATEQSTTSTVDTTADRVLQLTQQKNVTGGEISYRSGHVFIA